MKFVKICSRANGDSHFSDEFWTLSDGDFTPPSPKGYSVTETIDATGVLMMHHPPRVQGRMALRACTCSWNRSRWLGPH